jgi:flagellar basal body-associated protein FliL
MTNADRNDHVIASQAPSARDGGVMPLVVAAFSFVVVLTMIVGVYLLISRGPADAASSAGAKRPQSASELVTLIDNNHFVMPLSASGDGSVTCEYTIAVRVAGKGRAALDDLVAPDGRNMLAAVREQVRKIIAAEDVARLRGEQLDGVKRRIRAYLNGLMDNEAVEDVIFDQWNVIS